MSTQAPHFHPVSTDRVEVSYGGVVALADVTIELPMGVTVLLGHNGAGKSSLLRVLVGSQEPARGEVRRDGQSIAATGGATKEHRSATGWLPQRPGLPGNVSAVAFLEYVAWHIKLLKECRAREVQRVLHATDCEAFSRRTIQTLSGGQRQRVALAAALMGAPDLLLLDEPTAGLDPSQRELFYRTIRTVSSTAAIVMSTHLIEDVLEVADHVLVVADGGVRGPYEVANLVNGSHPSDALATLRALMGASS